MTRTEHDDAETIRLREDGTRTRNWKRWGPYLSERQWGTVREDYSANGDSWSYFPHDHARSRAYRWGEDGLLGITDRECRLCFAVALWNGRDPDPEGAALRPHRSRRQSRRGREGALLLPRRDADRLVPEGALQVPPGGVSVRPAGRGEPPARQARPGVRARRHRRVRREPLLRRLRRVRQGGARRHPDPPHHRQPRPRGGRAAPAADALVRNTWAWGRAGEGYWPTSPAAPRGRGDDRGRARVRWVATASTLAGVAGAALHRERDQRRAALRCAERVAIREGRVPRVRRHGDARTR